MSSFLKEKTSRRIIGRFSEVVKYLTKGGRGLSYSVIVYNKIYVFVASSAEVDED